MSKYFEAKVVANTQVTERHFILELQPLLNNVAPVPGQFYMVGFPSILYPLLKRPFSFLNYEEKSISFLIFVRGKGTEVLCRLNKGEVIDMIGPLGNGFPTLQDNEKLLIVAGGIGIASMLFLLKHYKGSIVFYGVRNRKELLLYDQLRGLSSELHISTDDGSMGEKGNVTSMVQGYILNNTGKNKFSVYACGPHAMYKTMKDVLWGKDIDVFVSLEERMGCGVGACLSCVVLTNDGYKRICKEGPVFNLREIVL